jgi:hypothetical protein
VRQMRLEACMEKMITAYKILVEDLKLETT